MMINIIEEKPHLQNNSFTSVLSKQTYDADWRDAANKLNVLGATRSVMQWQKALRNWVTRTKSKIKELNIQNNETGGGPKTLEGLSELEIRLINAKGWKTIVGDVGTYETKFGDIRQHESNGPIRGPKRKLQNEEDSNYEEIINSNETKAMSSSYAASFPTVYKQSRIATTHTDTLSKVYMVNAEDLHELNRNIVNMQSTNEANNKILQEMRNELKKLNENMKSLVDLLALSWNK